MLYCGDREPAGSVSEFRLGCESSLDSVWVTETAVSQLFVRLVADYSSLPSSFVLLSVVSVTCAQPW